MVKVKLLLCDDAGNILPGSSSNAYALELGSQTLNEIEAAVEQFRRKALPELEAELLGAAQSQQTHQLKKPELPSSMERRE